MTDEMVRSLPAGDVMTCILFPLPNTPVHQKQSFWVGIILYRSVCSSRELANIFVDV